MAYPGICILVAINIDLLCGSIVKRLLQNFSHEELHSGDALDVLTAVCDARERINGVLTNLHRIESRLTSDILHHVKKKLRLDTLFMSPDDREIKFTGKYGFVAYIVHSFNNNDVQKFWTMSGIERDEVANAILMKQPFSPNGASSSESLEDEGIMMINGRKRCVWTEKMHRNFLLYIHSLPSWKKPSPTEIVEHLDIPGLDTKMVASHLQTYKKRHEKKEYGKAKSTSPLRSVVSGGLSVECERIAEKAKSKDESRKFQLFMTEKNETSITTNYASSPHYGEYSRYTITSVKLAMMRSFPDNHCDRMDES